MRAKILKIAVFDNPITRLTPLSKNSLVPRQQAGPNAKRLGLEYRPSYVESWFHHYIYFTLLQDNHDDCVFCSGGGWYSRLRGGGDIRVAEGHGVWEMKTHEVARS